MWGLYGKMEKNMETTKGVLGWGVAFVHGLIAGLDIPYSNIMLSHNCPQNVRDEVGSGGNRDRDQIGLCVLVAGFEAVLA